MNISKFTQKSIEAVNSLEKLAYEYGNQEIEQEHLLYALLKQEDSLILAVNAVIGGQIVHNAQRVGADGGCLVGLFIGGLGHPDAGLQGIGAVVLGIGVPLVQVIDTVLAVLAGLSPRAVTSLEAVAEIAVAAGGPLDEVAGVVTCIAGQVVNLVDVLVGIGDIDLNVLFNI